MARKASRPRLTEEVLAKPREKKAETRAEKAADKAERVAKKIRKKRNPISDAATRHRTKLSFQKQGGKATHSVTATVSKKLHSQVAKDNQDNNTAVEAANTATDGTETGIRTVNHTVYSKKLKAYQKAAQLQAKADTANVEAIFQQRMAEYPEVFSNPISRMKQKKAIRQEYAAARRAEQAAAKGGSATKEGVTEVKSIAQRLSELKDKGIEYIAEHPQMILTIAGLALLIMALSSALSSCSAFLPSGFGAVVATTFTAKDGDIIGANEDYKALEADLQRQIDSIQATHPGYDEYNFHLDEIGHDPYQLAAYLTTQFEDYTRAEVQDTLRRLFHLQYVLNIEEVVETRTRTETHTSTSMDPVTGETTEDSEEVEVEYEYYILNITLTNKNLGHVIAESGGMTEKQAERYGILLLTKGNKAKLFEDEAFVSAGSDYLDYDIPGEALTDERFRNMVNEAEKYLGYPYVWGGSSPSTSFDCSGFVSWVINHCGNGWNVGRLTANGLKNYCQTIRASDAKPGDLVFFRGTYNTSGASHVGIYVGNGMMIHCGNPISYASINTPYWQRHFYCFGRLP
nr:NlpC/P60 family protein [uncultured Stomatobaculum sp.]